MSNIDVNITQQSIDVTVSENDVLINVVDSPVYVNVNDQPITVEVSGVGPQGPAGEGVPTGGTTGQVLAKVSNTNYDTHWITAGAGSVTSVDMTVPTGLSISGNPITTSGTLALALSSGYVIPTQATIDAKVPYTGATGDVDLGEYEIKAGQLELDQTPTGTAGVAVTRWNDTVGTIETTLKGGNVIFKHGRDMFERVVNKTGIQLTKAAYQAVKVSDAQGQRLAIGLAQANNDLNSADTIGLVVETINNNQEGFIYTVGELNDINTTGSLQGETWTDGDVLYLSPTTAGKITNLRPYAPDHLVIIGYVVYAHQNNGKIYVKINNGFELGELHDVDTRNATNGQVLTYNSSTGVWLPATNASGTVTSVGLTSSTSGVTISNSPITSSGNIGLSIASASGSQNGLLNSTDWNTFNNKPSVNLYTGDGTLTGNRTVTLSTYTLSFTKDLLINSVTVGGGINPTYGNTILGKDAMFSDVSSDDNVAIGTNAMYSATAARSNTAVGNYVLDSITTGERNAAFGVQALTQVTTGFANVGVGYYAGQNISTGQYNIFIGHQSGQALTTGSSNIAIGNIGFSSLNAASNYNTLIGNGLNLAALGQIDNNIILTDGQGSIKYRWDGSSNNLYGTLTVSTINAATTDTDKFLVSDNGELKFRTGAELLSDIGGQAAGSYVPTSRTLTINGTGYDLSVDRSWSVGTITALTGEVTASGSGSVSATVTNSAVIGKVLTGLNLTGGGTIAATDTILQAFGKVQNQISALVGSVQYEGVWNASTNSPTILGGTGNKGDYYVVNVAGTVSIDGIGDWKVGDWIIFNGSTWDKVDNTDAVSSVNGFTGAVSLSTSNISEGTNLYFTNTRAQNAITLTTSGTSGSATYSGGTLNIPTYSLSGLGGVPTSRQLTINGTAYDLSADRSWSVGTVTSIGVSSSTSGVTIGSTPVTTSGTITVDIATASGSSNGLLSSTDWTTFNNKQNALTNPVTGTGTINYLPKFTGTSTIGNSAVSDDGTTITLNARALSGTSATFTTSLTPLVLKGTNASTMWTEYYYNTSTLTGYIGNGSGILSGASASDFIFRSEGDYVVATGGNNRRLTIASTGAATFSSSVTVGTDIQYSSNAGYGILSQNSTRVLAFTNSSVVANVNVGIGVTPSAWFSSWKAIEIGSGAFVYPNDAASFRITQNWYLDSSATPIYKTTNPASQYIQSAGAHIWYNAPSGTAGNAITFTQAMTLDSSGRLGIGVTPSAWQSFRGLQVGQVGAFASNDFGSGNIQTFIGQNTYYDNAGFKYIQSGTAAMMRMVLGGEFQWHQTSTSGSANGAISFTQAMTLDASGRLGIGTSSPANKLDVNGNIGITSGNSAYFYRSANDYYWRIHSDTSNFLRFGTYLSNGTDYGTNPKVILQDDGKVGIGTSSPSVALELAGASNLSTRIRAAKTSSGTIEIGADRDTFGSPYISAITNSNLDFFTNDTHRMRITSGGSVGIGTSSPNSSYKLDLTGDFSAIFNVTSTANSATYGGFVTTRQVNTVGNGNGIVFGMYNSSNATTEYAYIGTIIEANTAAANNGAIVFNPTSSGSRTERMRITSGGDVLIGLTSGGRFSVRDAGGNDTHFGLGANYDNYITAGSSGVTIFRNSSTERMRITSGGEVYIAGTTDQGAYNLQVNGTGVWGAGAYVNGSDARLKNDITDLSNSLELVKKLRPVTFKYNEEYSKDQNIQTGFIAQELIEVFKDENYLDGLVQKGPEYYNVAYQNLIPVLVKALQEQQEQINELKLKINA